MSLCPACGRILCDHEPDERGQTYEEMMRPLTPEEEAVWRTSNTDRQIEVARKNAHLPVSPATPELAAALYPLGAAPKRA